jgi:hypothetical protein
MLTMTSLTLKQAKAELKAIGCTIRKANAGDYRVRMTAGLHATDYFTDALDDAVSTAKVHVAHNNQVFRVHAV